MATMTQREVILVTGGSRGIGRAIVESFGRRKWHVILSFLEDESAAADAVRAIEAAGGRADAVRADLGVPADIHHLFERIRATTGRLDMVVNNAAVSRRDDPQAPDMELFDDLFAVNVRGVYLCSTLAARMMCENEGAATDDGVAVRGRIVNISGIPGRTTPPPGMTLYGATKAAVDSLTRSMAGEWGPRGILINAVAPGITRTDKLADEKPEVIETLRKRSVLGRLGHPEDVARLVSYLADDAWLVGQSLNLSGGRLM